MAQKNAKIDKPKTYTREESVGHYARIKRDIKLFVDGLGIPEKARTTDIYVRGANFNGTVTIGYVDSGRSVGTLFWDQIEVLDQVRTYNDTIEVESDIDVRIFGVAERMDNIKTNKTRLHLDDDNIFIDENKDGVLLTALRAWSKPTDKPFVMVLQDDVELCDDFMVYCQKIIEAHPDDIIALFPAQFLSENGTRLPDKTPYVETNILTAQGIIMKSDYIKECTNTWEPSLVGDDTNIMRWAQKTGKRIITTLPATLQHIGDRSVFDRTRSLGRTDFYSKRPINVNWDSREVVNWKSVKK